MKKVSLNIITKDDGELKELKRAVNSCVKYVDFVNITCTNKPYKKTEKYCKKNNYKYTFFKWVGDFAKARNFNFAQSEGDIDFWIDTDDVVMYPDKIREAAELIEDEKTDWIFLEYIYQKDEYGNVLARHWKPRLTKKGTGKWEKSVHETYAPTQRIKNLRVEDLYIDHRPVKERFKKSSERNLSILMEEFNEDGEKTDPRTLFYIGNTLRGLERWNEAAEFYTMYIKKTGWDEEKYFAYHSLCHCLSNMGEHKLGVNIALKAIEMKPEWCLGYFDLSNAYSALKKYDKVVEWTLVGLQKETPDTLNMINDLEINLYPIGRLADAYLMTGRYKDALAVAKKLEKKHKTNKLVKDLVKDATEAYKTDEFVKNFINVANKIRMVDRIKSIKLFDCLPASLDDDIRIQELRSSIVPPHNWEKNTIVIYCGKGIGEEWAYPSIFKGIGGSEEAVINMSQQLTKLGYKVVVYNHCGGMRGEYDGVEYRPFYHFNPNDNFDILISWRAPSLFELEIRANKKIVWLHDIAFKEQFSDKAIARTDKFIFLSKWHRNNMPSIPDEKIFISNNGIDPEHFKEKKKKRPNSLFWGSSYDRGLLTLVKDIMPLIRKEIPDITLDICYGWQNIDAEKDQIPELQKLRDELTPLLEQDYITHHGRISHKAVADLMKECMVYAYSSEFGETNNITSQKAQASDCYVITTSQAGGTPERIKFGKIVEGNNIYTDKKMQEKYAKEVIKHLRDPESPKKSPRGLIKDFSWESTAKTWKEGLL